MADVIQLLPDSVANQIAAGEVVQRPASVVKELLENAVDAGANKIQLIVRDAGKTLIQVIDNGCGMSETDARMSFERHATSKIRESKDLFALHTFGFRGEALASIAAVAQVEMKTRRSTDELGTRLVVEDSFVKVQEPCQAPLGTSISVKNLFYTVPARKSFLKADPVETRHILDEFQRVAMANPDVFFSLHHNDSEIFHLPIGNLRQRVVKIFGEAVNKKLVPAEQETDILHISGFVGKPDYVKKTRGEQLFFVNKRFIRSNYLHHAVMSAYEDLLPADTYPLYVLFLDINPASVDINVHPTKQEIKFDDERLVYNFLKVAVRHALGSHNVTPTLDFEQEPAFQQRLTPAPVLRPERESSSVGTFRPSKFDQDGPAASRHTSNLENWEKLYKGLELFEKGSGGEPEPTTDEPVIGTRPGVEVLEMDDDTESFSKGQREPYQVHGQYIISHIKSGYLLIDQQAASERVLYERYLAALEHQPIATQKALFPKTVELSAADAHLLRDILEEVNCLGFEISEFGGNTFAIHGSPAELRPGISEETLLQKVLEQYKGNLELQLGARDNLARSMARNAAMRKGQPLTVPEMQDLIDRLFACTVPFNSPSGRKCFIQYDLEELQRQFS
ncbi:MAG: DNA mismatch repair endonuclease MutL [Saprospiraceae bacterium]|nr:DNA mismatch repair endonuclease MutL [Saprospiraceae bacterium]